MQASIWQSAVTNRDTSVHFVICLMVITAIPSMQNHFSAPSTKWQLLPFSGYTPTSPQNAAAESVVSHSPQETVRSQPTANTEVVPQPSLRSLSLLAVLHWTGPIYPRYNIYNKQRVLFPYSKLLASIRHTESGSLYVPEEAEHRVESSYGSPGQYISNLAFHVSAMIWSFLYKGCKEI